MITAALRAWQTRRWIRAAVLGQLSPTRTERLHRRLRGDVQARREYDRMFAAMRLLEHAEIATAEVELVERWVVGETPRSVEDRGAHTRFAAVALLAATAAIVLAVGLRPPPAGELWTARGGAATGLAIEVLCGRASGDLHATGVGCRSNDRLGFAYRADPVVGEPGVLTLFGIDEAGRVLYYSPTPVDPEPLAVVASGRRRALSIAVDLAINHAPGTIRVFALRSARAWAVSDVDDAAAELVGRPPLGPGDRPWHELLSDQVAMGRVCSIATACQSAEQSFRVYEESP